jgi:hypothetical protein
LEHEDLKKRRNFVSFCLTPKTPFGSTITLRISLRRRAIRHESRLCGEPKSLIALVHRKTPATFVGVHYLAVPKKQADEPRRRRASLPGALRCDVPRHQVGAFLRAQRPKSLGA